MLSTVKFRARPTSASDVDAHNLALARAIQQDGRVYLAPATVDGRVYLRVCFTNFRTTAEDVVEVLTVRATRRPPGRDPVAPDTRPRERRQGSRGSARNHRGRRNPLDAVRSGAGDVRGDGGVTGVTRHGFNAPLISRTGVIHRGALSVGTRSSDERPRKARRRSRWSASVLAPGKPGGPSVAAEFRAGLAVAVDRPRHEQVGPRCGATRSRSPADGGHTRSW